MARKAVPKLVSALVYWVVVCLASYRLLSSLAGRRPLQQPVGYRPISSQRPISLRLGAEYSLKRKGEVACPLGFSFVPTKQMWRREKSELARQGGRTPRRETSSYSYCCCIYIHICVCIQRVCVYTSIDDALESSVPARHTSLPSFTLFFSLSLFSFNVFVVWLFYPIHSVHIHTYTCHGYIV